MTTLSQFDPRYSFQLGGFDRRGAAASINNVTANSCKVTGYFSDLADFVTLYIFDTDDPYGHVDNSKRLPTFDLTGVVIEFDLQTTNCYYPGSYKFPSVPWDSLQWIKSDESSGSVKLPLSGAVGGTKASVVLTVGGVPAAFDRVQIIYLGNTVFDYILDGADTISSVINSTVANTNGFLGLVKQINNANVADPIANPYSATGTATQITISSTSKSIDGNSIQFLTQYKTAGTTTISPANAKMSGGIDPSSVHVILDLHSLGLENVRQLWLTVAPIQPYDSSGSAQTVQAFTQLEFAYEITNLTITDPNSKCPAQVANPGSVLVNSRDLWARFNGSWSEEVGFYNYGFAKASSAIGNKVRIIYSCQSVHDLYLGTSLSSDRGQFTTKVDGVAAATIDCYADALSQINTRRLIKTNVPAGKHQVEITIAIANIHSSGNTCYFDFLQACIPGDPVSPGTTYPTISAALDFDTDQTYKIPASRNLLYLQQAGLLGDVDIYAGVFFALKRRRRGGFFHTATITVAGTLDSGSGFGDGDVFFLDIGGTSFGVAVFPADTLNTVKQRFINAINSLFVGVWAFSGGVGVVTIQTLSPINGFTLSKSSVTATATWTLVGDIHQGNEGIWEVDPTQVLPLNKGFTDYLENFTNVFAAAGLTFTLAYSQELLAPPDQNTIADSWIQRFTDASTVLTSTAFGSWGLGVVEAVTGSGTITIKQTGHGYINGYLISVNNVGAFSVTVVDTDHFSIVGSANVGDIIRAQLQTSQCNFNPATFTAYITNCYLQSAAIIKGICGVDPWLQFGEMGWWFFPGLSPTDTRGMSYYDEFTKDAASVALGRPLASFVTPNDDPSINAFVDANFLYGQIQSHLNSIRTAVLAAWPTTKFSWLWPSDVNWRTAFFDMITAPIGGQLNRYVNTPPAYLSPGSDIDRIDGEALAWGTTYRTIDNAIESMAIPITAPWTWTLADVKYFVPWQNAGCPWQEEFLQTVRINLTQLVFWAFDHYILFSWKIPFPTDLSGVE